MKLKLAFVYLLAASILLPPLCFAKEPATKTAAACPELEGLLIIGEAEYVTLDAADLRFKARIDTGAQTSSFSMTNPQPFERDGKKWLKFSVEDPNSGKLIDFERPVIRIAEIKRHGAEAVERPVVKLKISLANIEMEREFTLADRSKYEYPVLIGRNVLQGKYVVDVNRKYTTHKRGDTEE